MAARRQSESEPKRPRLTLPPGFDEAGQPDIDGWYTPREGRPVHGKLIGDFVMRQPDQDGSIRERQVVLVRLAAPYETLEGEDRTPRTLAPGQVMAVGLNYNLQWLLDYVDSRAEVIFMATGKQRLKSGRTIWKFQSGAKGRKSPRQPQTQQTSGDDAPDF